MVKFGLEHVILYTGRPRIVVFSLNWSDAKTNMAGVCEGSDSNISQVRSSRGVQVRALNDLFDDGYTTTTRRKR
jgi:hypothetical protein